MALASRQNMRFLPLSFMFASGFPALVWAHEVTEAAAAAQIAQWNFDPWVTVPLALSALLYAIGLLRLWRAAGTGRGLSAGQASAFAGGWVALFAALVSPLDALGGWSFAWHMVQHEVLMLIAAPLLVVSRPLAAWAWALPFGARRTVGGFARSGLWAAPWRVLTSPLGAWTAHAVALWAWHAPAAFNASLLDETVHSLQHLSFLLTALLFWWAVLGRAHFNPGGAIVSLLTTMVHTGVLGALLTFSPLLWYAAYSPRLQELGVNPLTHQQLGGLIMWVPAGAVYLAVALVLARLWLRAPREDDARGVPLA